MGKVYVGGDSEGAFGACVANSVKEAKALLWTDSDVRDACDGEYYRLRAHRDRRLDNIARAWSLETGVVRNSAVLRAIGFGIDGDPACIACGLYTMDGEFPLCPDCEQCADCGHAEYCEEASA